MACYYLVISSTHLSNGHFRSIKGVFRGPLCKNGSESLDYAGKEKAIAKAVEDLKANFYCELCDKQYHKHQEFDNHINSYDHAHKQRLKELKQREFARNVASKSRKDEKKQEKALKRLHQLAELRKQTECTPGSAPMFKPATMAIDSHSKRVVAGPIAKDRDTGRKSNTRASCKKEALKKNLENSLPSTAQVQGQFGLKPFSLFTNKSSSYIHKGSISFSFSKKVPVKLESSASVFDDTIEEKQSEDEPQNCKVKAEPAMLGVPGGQNSMACTENNEQMKQSQMGSGIGSNPFARVKKLKALMLKENKDEEGKEYYCYTPTLCKTKTKFPFLLFMKSSETTDAGKLSAHDEKNKGFHTDSSNFKCREIAEIGDGQNEVRDAKKMATPQLNYLTCQQIPNQEDGKTSDQDTCKMKNEALSMFSEKQTEPQLRRLEASHRPKPITGPFLHVLSRDGSTILQWPSELLLFTQTEPSISYSCNPLYFDFKLSRNKNQKNGTTEPESNMEHQHNVAVAIEEDNGAGIREAQNISVATEEDLKQRKLIGSHKSKKRKHHHKTDKRLMQKPENGYVENVIKKVRGKWYKQILKEKDKYALKITDPESQSTEEDLKEEKYSRLTPKCFLQDRNCSTNEESEHISSSVIKKPSVSPLDLSNKKQKISPDNSLSTSKEMSENQKMCKFRHDSLNLNCNETGSIKELHGEDHKLSSHCSYEDDSESNRSNCRKSRSYSSSHGSSIRSSSDTSSDRSRTSNSSRNYSDRSSDYSHRSQSRYCSKMHQRSHCNHKCHSKCKKNRFSYSSVSSLSSDNDHHHWKRSVSRSRSRDNTRRTHSCTKGRIHGRSRNSSSSRHHSRSRSRYRSRSRHSGNRQESPIKDYSRSRHPSLRRSCSRNKEQCRKDTSNEGRHRSSTSFSKDRVYHIKSSLCYRDCHEIQRGTEKFHGTIKNEYKIQNHSSMSPSLFQKNYTIGCSILNLKEMIKDEKEPQVTQHLLEKLQCNKIEEGKNTAGNLTSASTPLDLNLNDPAQGYGSPRLPPSVDNMTLLSVFGKLAAIEKVVEKNDDTSKNISTDKADEPENSKWSENETASTTNQEQSLLMKEVYEDKTDIEEGSMNSLIKTAEDEQIGPTIYQVQPAEEDVSPVPKTMSNVVSCVTDDFDNSSMVVKEKHSQMTFYDSSDTNSVPLGDVTFDYNNTNSENVDKVDPPFMETAKSNSTALASQPITFTPDEMEKYSKLQLQAQQHIQQQFLAKQVKTFPSSASLTFSPVPAFQPVSIQQPSAAAATVTTVHHTLLQHHAAATLTAAHQQAMTQLHHITQPHITPLTFSPITHSIFPAHPTTFLAGHPLHFIPAAAIHPAQLALHPLPHTTLCPTLFAPHPVAAAAAASAIHFHPLLHPLFPGHDLQHRSPPNT
ncbi:G patch domain-containing protein 8 isoform X1 [Stegostoma tigrinum]|uniref:G patch domain-containing protein 8 isoform X1 n=2 Tax=Stegostoma tigrinum TaxID=3053191 RepID=UPI00202B9EFE|nr:G patch domain-containing protein 8 isoform X1 [Stegostoma tigrinum]